MAIITGVTVVYLLGLTIAYFTKKEPKKSSSSYTNTFAIIVPAHNEEVLIGALCESLLSIDYPHTDYKIFVVSDNCSDKTIEICSKYSVAVLERNDLNNPGKGQALAWALTQININEYNAIFIVDADNYVDKNILSELNIFINNGEVAVQCHNAVGNREDSGFTQLLYVSRTVGNYLYHHAKYKLGLSSYLMGNGLCFSSELLQKKGWTALSIAEDWEFYAMLIRDGIKIAFALNAKVFHQESKSIRQATTQRLRWSSGRFKIARTFGVEVLWDGIKNRNLRLIDSALPLIMPNYSLLVNLTLTGLFTSFALPTIFFDRYIQLHFVILLVVEIFLFLAGAFIAGSSLKIFKAIIFAPFFLIWKLMIDLVSFTNIYKTNEWIRTERHTSKLKKDN